MTIDFLINTASKIKQVSTSAAEEYSSKTPILVTKLNETMLNRKDIEKLIGDENISMMKDNHANHARFISTIIANYEPKVFVETVLWVFNAYTNHGFNSIYWAAQLNTWIQILQEELSEATYKEIFPFYDWMQSNIPVFTALSSKVKSVPPEH